MNYRAYHARKLQRIRDFGIRATRINAVGFAKRFAPTCLHLERFIARWALNDETLMATPLNPGCELSASIEATVGW